MELISSPRSFEAMKRLVGKRNLATIAGLLLASGIAATPGCMFNRAPSEKSVSHSQPLGKDSMSLAQKRPAVLHAGQDDFDRQVLRSDVPVLVDFYAEWCGPCKRLGPVLEELAAETPYAKIVKVNVDENPQLAAEYGVNSIPSLKLFENGQITDQVVGLASKDCLRSMLAR
jgi:thioredoxin 1